MWVAGSNPAETVGFLGGEKILSTPSFGGKVKPSVADLRHVKEPWKLRGSRLFQAKFVGHFSSISVPRYQRALMSLDVGRLLAYGLGAMGW
jgi:hypothetical protein